MTATPVSTVYRPFGAFRFTLASLVVVSHTHELAGFGAVLSPLGLGNMGVMTFFVLSGYVIAEAITVFYSGRPGAFLVNRALRIFPPFFVALAFSVFLHAIVAQSGALRFFDPVEHPERMFDAQNITGNALMLLIPVGLGRLGFSVDYIYVRYAWAVAIELLFYYAIALLVWCAITPAVRRAVEPHTFWSGAMGLFLLMFVASMLVSDTGVYGSGWIPYFMLGIALFHLSMRGAPERRAGALVLAVVCLVCVNWHAYQYIGRTSRATVLESLVILNVLLLALWLLSRAAIGERWTALDRLLGDLTYPLYLNHYAVSVALLSLVPAEHFGIGLFIGNFGASVLFSYVAMQCSEPLTRRLRDRIRGRRL